MPATTKGAQPAQRLLLLFAYLLSVGGLMGPVGASAARAAGGRNAYADVQRQGGSLTGEALEQCLAMAERRVEYYNAILAMLEENGLIPYPITLAVVEPQTPVINRLGVMHFQATVAAAESVAGEGIQTVYLEDDINYLLGQEIGAYLGVPEGWGDNGAFTKLQEGEGGIVFSNSTGYGRQPWLIGLPLYYVNPFTPDYQRGFVYSIAMADRGQVGFHAGGNENYETAQLPGIRHSPVSEVVAVSAGLPWDPLFQVAPGGFTGFSAGAVANVHDGVAMALKIAEDVCVKIDGTSFSSPSQAIMVARIVADMGYASTPAASEDVFLALAEGRLHRDVIMSAMRLANGQINVPYHYQQVFSSAGPLFDPYRTGFGQTDFARLIEILERWHAAGVAPDGTPLDEVRGVTLSADITDSRMGDAGQEAEFLYTDEYGKNQVLVGTDIPLAGLFQPVVANIESSTLDALSSGNTSPEHMLRIVRPELRDAIAARLEAGEEVTLVPGDIEVNAAHVTVLGSVTLPRGVRMTEVEVYLIGADGQPMLVKRGMDYGNGSRPPRPAPADPAVPPPTLSAPTRGAARDLFFEASTPGLYGNANDDVRVLILRRDPNTGETKAIPDAQINLQVVVRGIPTHQDLGLTEEVSRQLPQMPYVSTFDTFRVHLDTLGIIPMYFEAAARQEAQSGKSYFSDADRELMADYQALYRAYLVTLGAGDGYSALDGEQRALLADAAGITRRVAELMSDSFGRMPLNERERMVNFYMPRSVRQGIAELLVGNRQDEFQERIANVGISMQFALLSLENGFHFQDAVVSALWAVDSGGGHMQAAARSFADLYLNLYFVSTQSTGMLGRLDAELLGPVERWWRYLGVAEGEWHAYLREHPQEVASIQAGLLPEEFSKPATVHAYLLNDVAAYLNGFRHPLRQRELLGSGTNQSFVDVVLATLDPESALAQELVQLRETEGERAALSAALDVISLQVAQMARASGVELRYDPLAAGLQSRGANGR